MSSLLLVVAPAVGDDIPTLVSRVELLWRTGMISQVQVNTTGLGFGVAELLTQRGVPVLRLLVTQSPVMHPTTGYPTHPSVYPRNPETFGVGIGSVTIGG